MRHRNLVLFIFLLSMIFSGCRTFVPFTDLHREEFENFLYNLQFYTSQPIVLTRDIGAEEKLITDNTRTIRIEHNRKIMEITIPKHTPGILKSVREDTLHVQFEPRLSGEDRTIPFARITKHKYLPKDPGDYIYQFRPRDKKIRYEGKEHTVSFLRKKTPVSKKDTDVYVDNPDKKIPSHYVVKTLYPVLTISPVEKISKFEKKQRTAPGMPIRPEEQEEEKGAKAFLKNLFNRIKFWE